LYANKNKKSKIKNPRSKIRLATILPFSIHLSGSSWQILPRNPYPVTTESWLQAAARSEIEDRRLKIKNRLAIILPFSKPIEGSG